MTAHDPHIIAAVRRMKGERARDAEIAMAVGLTEDSLKWLCHKHRIRRPVTKTIEIGAGVLDCYRKEATKRGQKLEPFMRKLLQTIATDNLFQAILDDDK